MSKKDVMECVKEDMKSFVPRRHRCRRNGGRN